MAQIPNFDLATRAFIEAIQEHRVAHAMAMQSTDVAVQQQYVAALEAVELAHKRWLREFAVAPRAPDLANGEADT